MMAFGGQPRATRNCGRRAAASTTVRRAGSGRSRSRFRGDRFLDRPSGLYGLYEHRERLSSITITIVYAVYVLALS